MTSPCPSSSSSSSLYSPSSSTSSSPSPKRKRPNSPEDNDTAPSPKKRKQKTRHLSSTSPRSHSKPLSCPRTKKVCYVAQTTLQAACSSPSSSQSNSDDPMEGTSSGSGQTTRCKKRVKLEKHRKQKEKQSLLQHTLHPKTHPDRLFWNALFINKLQKEIYCAQQTLDTLDIQAMQLFANTPPSFLGKEPVLYVKRPPRHANRMDWNKLKKAIQRLDRITPTSSSPRIKIGNTAASKVVSLLQRLYKKEKANRRTRSFVQGAAFTRLCAQVLASQDIWVKPTTPLTDVVATVSFISGTDVPLTEQNPAATFDEQWAVGLLQHKGTNMLKPEEEESDDND